MVVSLPTTRDAAGLPPSPVESPTNGAVSLPAPRTASLMASPILSSARTMNRGTG
jgi:hypothetical protein